MNFDSIYVFAYLYGKLNNCAALLLIQKFLLRFCGIVFHGALWYIDLRVAFFILIHSTEWRFRSSLVKLTAVFFNFTRTSVSVCHLDLEVRTRKLQLKAIKCHWIGIFIKSSDRISQWFTKIRMQRQIKPCD